MNSTHHANRANRGRDSGRGRGRGRGRDYRAPHPRGSEVGTVPTIQHVLVGAPVSIVLKMDQPTGRQVQGFAAEVLTRGNHPRGIKVRLRDGRVGRVQRMASEEEATVGATGLAGLGRDGEGRGGCQTSTDPGTSAFSRTGYNNFRLDEPDALSNQGLSLESYIVTKSKGKGQPQKAASQEPTTTANSTDIASMTSVCPVCGKFEGDEIAVAHHVNGHFE